MSWYTKTAFETSNGRDGRTVHVMTVSTVQLSFHIAVFLIAVVCLFIFFFHFYDVTKLSMRIISFPDYFTEHGSPLNKNTRLFVLYLFLLCGNMFYSFDLLYRP